MSASRLIVAYACLVGMPLFGLANILRVGERLVAPASVEGLWTGEADLRAVAGTSCGEWLARVRQPFMTVTQSGNRAVVTLNDPPRTTFSGTVEGASLTAVGDLGPATSDGGRCDESRAISLKATVERRGQPRVLVGALSVSGCAACGPVPFHATRQESPRGQR